MFLRVIYHLYEEVGKGSTAEFGILAAVQVAVVNCLLVGRVAKAAPLRCIAAHGSGSIGNAVVVMVVDGGELLCGGSRIGPCAVCAFQERACSKSTATKVHEQAVKYNATPGASGKPTRRLVCTCIWSRLRDRID